MEITEKTIIEIYDRIVKQDDLFGIKEIVNADSYKKNFSLMNYTGAYRALAAEYTETFGYEIFNEFLKRTAGIVVKYKPMTVIDPFGKSKKVREELERKLDEALAQEADEDTVEINFGDAMKAAAESFD